MPTERPKVSVIIPALNEARYIERTLKALKAQTFKSFEIIVVDGMSADKTREIAKKYAKVVIEERSGVSRARNTGAKYAKGNILVFLDADTVPSKNLLRVYNSIFRHPKVVAATGPILPLEKTNGAIKTGYKLVTVGLVKLSISVKRATIIGSNFAVRAKTFKKVGGFDPHLNVYEDWDLSQRLNKVGKVAYSKRAGVLTSARRAMAWGIPYYVSYHTVNLLKFYALKKTRFEYGPVR